MTVESLNDYFSGSHKKTSLGKIYLAHKIKEIIKEKTGMDVKVVIWGKEARLICPNNLVAQSLKLRIESMKEIYKFGVVFKVRVGGIKA